MLFCFKGCRESIHSRNAVQLEFLEQCLVGDLLKVKTMLDANIVDPNYRHPVNGWTALHWAARRGHTKICLLLLERGFSEGSKDRYDRTPWEVCSANNTVLRDILRPESLRIEKVMPGADNKRRFSTGADNSSPFAPKYIKHAPHPFAKATSFDSGTQLPDTPTTNANGYYLYGRRDSVNRTRFLLVRTSCADGKQSFKRVTLPGGSTLAQLKKMIEKSMRKGEVKSIRTLPDQVLIEEDAQITQFSDCQKVEVEYDSPAVIAEAAVVQQFVSLAH